MIYGKEHIQALDPGKPESKFYFLHFLIPVDKVLDLLEAHFLSLQSIVVKLKLTSVGCLNHR